MHRIVCRDAAGMPQDHFDKPIESCFVNPVALLFFLMFQVLCSRGSPIRRACYPYFYRMAYYESRIPHVGGGS
jgi:hypothetical protein